MMARNLHSFTLTDDASYEVKRMKKRTKSYQVSMAIEKYANDYKLSPDGVKYWMRLRSIEEDLKKQAWKELAELRSKQGFKHHLAGLLRCLSPFPRRKQV
jgi:hypothetical protein